ELTTELPPFFRAVAEAGGLARYGTRLLAGEVRPTWATDVAARPMNIAEKVIARRVWRGQGEPDGIASVAPGDQVLCRAGFRGMHEYTCGMVMSLYRDAWGDAPVEGPQPVAAL